MSRAEQAAAMSRLLLMVQDKEQTLTREGWKARGLDQCEGGFSKCGL